MGKSTRGITRQHFDPDASPDGGPNGIKVWEVPPLNP